MHIWTDATGRQWPVHFTWELLRKLRAGCDSLDDLVARLHAGERFDDVVDLAAVLQLILVHIDPQLTPEQFSRATEGRFKTLAEVFVTELSNFSQRQGLAPDPSPTTPPAPTTENPEN